MLHSDEVRVASWVAEVSERAAVGDCQGLRGLQVFVEKPNRVRDRLRLHRIGRIHALGVSPHEHEAMFAVLIALPFGILAELGKEIVADPEDALQLVTIAALHEDRSRDWAHAS